MLALSICLAEEKFDWSWGNATHALRLLTSEPPNHKDLQCPEEPFPLPRASSTFFSQCQNGLSMCHWRVIQEHRSHVLQVIVMIQTYHPTVIEYLETTSTTSEMTTAIVMYPSHIFQISNFPFTMILIPHISQNTKFFFPLDHLPS